MALVLVSLSGPRGGQPCSTPFLLYPIVPGRVLVPAALPLVISIPSPAELVPARLALHCICHPIPLIPFLFAARQV